MMSGLEASPLGLGTRGEQPKLPGSSVSDESLLLLLQVPSLCIWLRAGEGVLNLGKGIPNCK
jgi:hypothetical protein